MSTRIMVSAGLVRSIRSAGLERRIKFGEAALSWIASMPGLIRRPSHLKTQETRHRLSLGGSG